MAQNREREVGRLGITTEVTTRERNCNVENSLQENLSIGSEFHSSIKILHQNIPYIAGKKEQVEVFLSVEQPDIAIFTEHSLKENEIVQFHLTNYKTHSYYCRSICRSGGVTIMGKDHLLIKQINIINKYVTEKDIELAGVQVGEGSHRIAIVGVYRSPTGNWDSFTNNLSLCLEGLTQKYNRVILAGDFNVDVSKNTKCSREFLNMMSIFNLELKVNVYTRVTNFTNTIIDNIITNIDLCSIYVDNNDLSDHGYQTMEFQGKIEKIEHTNIIEKRDVHPSNLQELRYLISKESWLGVFRESGANEKCEKFIGIFKGYINVACPLRKKKVMNKQNTSGKDWITKEILVLREQVRELYNCWKETKSLVDKYEYNKLKRVYEKEIRLAKNSKIATDLGNACNLNREIWKIVNEERGKITKQDRFEKLWIDQNEIVKLSTDGNEICNGFNRYFQRAPIEILKNVCENNGNMMVSNSQDSLGNVSSVSFGSVTEEEVDRIINSLKKKKACGVDEITNDMLKECRQYIIKPIVHLINCSLEEGVFPDYLKISKIKPIHKGGDNNKPENYRPVSLLPALSKIYEKVVFGRLEQHLQQNNILISEQHGFRKGKSTKSALLEFVENVINGLEEGDKVMSVFLDLSKAFDCVDFEILLNKLKEIGVTGVSNDLFRSYLYGRKQCVEITKEMEGEVKKYKSGYLDVIMGVPQGSILGPVLFLIYVNHIPAVVQKAQPILYADDTALLCLGKDKYSLEIDSHIDVQSVVQFFSDIKLVTNEKKSNVLNFKNKYGKSKDDDVNVIIGSTAIEQSCSVKFLGVLVDENLSWNDHINYLNNKLSSNIFALRMISKLGNRLLTRAVYFGMIISHIQYSILLWGASSKQNLESIFKLQKKAIRYMVGIKSTDSCKEYFKDLKLMTVPAIYIYETILSIKRDNVKKNANFHDYNTRNRNGRHVEVHRTALYESKPSFIGAKFMEKLPQYIRDCVLVEDFKKRVKKFLIELCPYTVEEFLSL
jgi:hypothetical protein